MNGRGIAIAGLATLLFLTLTTGAAAESGDQRFRLGLVYGVPTDDLTDSGQTTELDEALGYQLSYEYFVADQIGLEAGLGMLSHDLTVSESGLPDINGETELMALTVNVNFHLLEDKAADFYAGPTLGYAFWDDVELTGFPDVPTDDDFIYGVNLGIDVPIGESKWGFTAALNYLFSEISIQGGGDIGVDPIHVKVGAVYRF